MKQIYVPHQWKKKYQFVFYFLLIESETIDDTVTKLLV